MSETKREDKLLAMLEAGEMVVGDGAMGTMLQAAGLTDGGAPELWNVEAPEKIRAIYEGYAKAGANLITTNTFGGTRARLKLHNLQDRAYELNLAGTRLAREVADEYGALVAGDIGPTGEIMEPIGPLSMDEARELFAEQARGLIDGGADYILIETMSHLDEVQAAVEGVRQVDPDITIVASMSFDTNYHTMMGVSPRQAAEAIASWGVRVLGANCGNGPAEIVAVMTQMTQYRPEGVYLLAQSNAGMPQYVDGEIQYDGTPEVMAEYAKTVRNLGVDVIGACCGSTPAHIAAIRAALEEVKDQPIVGPPPPAETGGAIESADSRAARAAERRRSRRRRSE
jgi:5-methyltetrahydrofolate--homocysteine methyltransferase